MANVLNYFKSPTLDGNDDNYFIINGTIIANNQNISAIKLKNSSLANDIAIYNSDGAISISGRALIEGGIGIANLTLAAPEEGCICYIKLASITSGTVIVTTESGITFDGTNNTATFNAIDDELIMGYKSITQWQIYTNNSVVLSSV